VTSSKLNEAIVSSAILPTMSSTTKASSDLFGRLATLIEEESHINANVLAGINDVAHVHEEDKVLRGMLEALPGKVEEHFEKMEVGKALDRIMECLDELNRHIQVLQWWSPIRGSSDPRKIRRAHYYMHETLRITSILLQPFMPSKSNEVLEILSIGRRGIQGQQGGRGWKDLPLKEKDSVARNAGRYTKDAFKDLFVPLMVWVVPSLVDPGRKVTVGKRRREVWKLHQEIEGAKVKQVEEGTRKRKGDE